MPDGNEIINTDATPASNSFEICMRSGFKYPRGTLVREWNGLWIHPKFAEPKHPADIGISITAERLTGSERPESPDNFLTSDISADDL